MNARQGISLFILGSIHLIFLLVLISEGSSSISVLSALVFSILFIGIAYFRAPRSGAIHPKNETLLLPFVVALAGVLTYYVSVDLHFGPVIASAGIGYIASYLPVIVKPGFFKSLSVPIYCGTFVGMCSSFLAEDYFFVSYAGLAAGLIYILTRDALNGVGGKLGSIAFGGVVIVSFIFSQL